MYKYRRGKENYQKKEKVPSQDLMQANQEVIKTDNIPEEQNNLEFLNNERMSQEKGKSKEILTENIYKNNEEKKTLSSKINKAKSRPIEDNIETSNFIENNKKLRNTMTGLNNDKMKYESGLIDIILKVEKDNVNHYLKGDLAEIYNDINNENYYFKNNVFLANVDNFEKKTGYIDKKPIIPYNCSEDISFKIDKYPTTNEIIEKFTEKAKTFSGYV